MDSDLMRQTLQRFVQQEIMPNSQSWDRQGELPPGLMRQLGDMGILGLTVPQAYGGMQQSVQTMAMALQELSYGDGATALSVAAHSGLCMAHILQAGSEAQKKHYLPKLCTGEWLGAWALTEPGSGSDAAGMHTQAKPVSGGFVLNGGKIFITQGTVADVVVVLAATDKEKKQQGIGAFILEKGQSGFSSKKLQHKLGMRASDTAVLSFEDIFVPSSHVLGGLQQGFSDTLKILDKGRIGVAALALGLAKRAFAASCKYTQERSQFGKRLSDFQNTKFVLSDMSTEIAAAAALIQQAAQRADAGERCTMQASMAKLFASEMAVRICEKAIQLHGGYGYLDEFPVERCWRDAKLCTIGEGTSEVQRIVIARELLR